MTGGVSVQLLRMKLSQRVTVPPAIENRFAQRAHNERLGTIHFAVLECAERGGPEWP